MYFKQVQGLFQVVMSLGKKLVAHILMTYAMLAKKGLQTKYVQTFKCHIPNRRCFESKGMFTQY